MDEFWSRFLAIEQRGFDFLADSHCRLDHYDIKVRIKTDRHCVNVTGTARGRVIGPAADAFRFLLGLDYRKPAETSCVINELVLDGHPAFVESDGHMHRVAFPRPRSQGETFELAFDYSTVPVARKCWVNAQSDWPVPGLGDGETELCFEGYWLPFANVLFQPVTFEIAIVDLPEGVVAVNGEPLGHRVEGSEGWQRYRSTVPTFPTVVAGDFEILTESLSGGSFSFYHQAGYSGVAGAVLATGSRILDLFTTWLKKNPTGDLSLIQLTRTGWGQYAPFPFVIFPRDDIKQDVTANDWKRVSQMLAHEIGHFWFGNMLRSGPTEQWLSEGFAQYFNLLYTEHAFGTEALCSELQRYVSRLAEIDIETQTPLVHITFEHPAQAILVRLKGAVVLHCLRQRLGFDRFVAFLAALVHRYQGQLITTTDVETEAGQFLGSQHAHSFFDTHLRGLATYTWDPATDTVIATLPDA